MVLPLMPRQGEAPYDPDPENNMGTDAQIVGKDYHFTWAKKKGQLTLHKGFSMKCRKAHFDMNGVRFTKPKAEK